MNKRNNVSTVLILAVFFFLFSLTLFFPVRAFADESAEKISFDVNIVWDDSQNPTCERNEFIRVQLFANDIDTGKEITLSESNDWKGTFSGLDKYVDGAEIDYSISECNLCDEYSCIVSGDAAEGFTIVNCSAISCISVVIDDVAVGIRPYHIAGLFLILAVVLLILLTGIKKLRHF